MTLDAWAVWGVERYRWLPDDARRRVTIADYRMLWHGVQRQIEAAKAAQR